MKTLIILNDEKNLKNTYKYPKGSIVISENEDLRSEVKKLGFEFKKIDDYLGKKAYENIGREAILLVREWGKLKVNEKTLKEFLTYKDLPFWDMIESNFAINLFESSKKLNNVKLMKEIIKTENPDKIVTGDKTIPERAAICVAKSFRVEVEKIDSSPLENFKFYYDIKLRNYLLRYIKILKEIERTLLTKRVKKWFKGNKKKILIIPNIETHTSIVAPVIRELEKNTNYELLTLRFGSIRERMKKSLGRAGIKNIPVEAFATKEVEERANDAIKFLKGRWKILETSEKFKRPMKYMGIPIWDLVKEDFELYFSTMVKIVEIVKHAETIREILEKERPDLILSLDELSEMGKPMALLARKRKIPLLIIQHGLFGKGSFIYGPSMATKKCVWGPYIKKMLLERWFTKEQIVITGCPKFDALAKKKFMSKERLCKELSLDPGKDIILFASQPAKEIKRIANMILKTMKQFPDKQLIIKLHPREYNEPLYRKLAKKIGINIIITKNFDLYRLLANCKLLVTTFSTVGLEALILGKSVITINLTSEPDPMSFTQRKAALGIHKESDLLPTLKKVFEDRKFLKKLKKYRDKFVYDYAYKKDGKATERIVKLIENILS